MKNAPHASDKKIKFEAADVEVRARLDEGGSLTLSVLKAGTCVHQVVVADAATPMEHSWIANLFAREDRIALSSITSEAHEYLVGLNTNQG